MAKAPQAPPELNPELVAALQTHAHIMSVLEALVLASTPPDERGRQTVHLEVMTRATAELLGCYQRLATDDLIEEMRRHAHERTASYKEGFGDGVALGRAVGADAAVSALLRWVTDHLPDDHREAFRQLAISVLLTHPVPAPQLAVPTHDRTVH